MPEAEINDEGMVECPVCGYCQEAVPGVMTCENSEEDQHVFVAVQKNVAA